MGKSFSKLNVKAQYCCLIKNFEQQLDDDTKLFFQHGRSSKITTIYVKQIDKEGGKSIAVKILEKQQWRH